LNTRLLIKTQMVNHLQEFSKFNHVENLGRIIQLKDVFSFSFI